jgi:ATP/maltotriose-dependent transcriptional regulator MalT
MLGSDLALLEGAALALDRGDPMGAAELAERFLRAVQPEDRMERVAGLELLVRAQAALGEHAPAAETLRALEAIATVVATPALRAAAKFSEGIVAVAGGDYEVARRRFEDAVDLFGRSGAPYEVARSRLELASVLAALGRSEAAAKEVGAAREALKRIGAGREASRAAALLRQVEASGRGRNGKAAGLASLTPRELDVLRLVARGLSDKQIAAALGLSEHTVHRHIANVLAKMGLPSRAAAVAQAAHQGLI